MEKLTQKQVWDEIAQDWSRFKEKPRHEVAGFIERCNGNLLDLGCGSGRHFLKKKDLKIYGIDFSEKMIELAKENSSDKKVDIELKLMQDEKIPYPDGFFDNVICVAVLHCVETKEKRLNVLREISRVLKNNGKAFIQVWSKNQKRVKNKGKEAFIPWTVKKGKVERYSYFYDLEELKQELEHVGFKVLRIEEADNISAVVGKVGER